MSGKLFVFDLDDTLIDNVHDYAQPILDAAGLIVEELGSKAPHVTKIINLEQEIDSRRVKETNPKTGKQFLYSMDRFPGSLAEVYKHICASAKIIPKATVMAKLFSIGLMAFDEERYIKNIKPGTKEVIDFLNEQGDMVVLLTKGDRGVQAKKVVALQEANIMFLRVDVVDSKTSLEFRIMTSLALSPEWYSVGNSYESDIVPALEAGYKGIFIPVETWDVIGKMDEIISKVDKEKCLVFENIMEIKERYEELV